MLKLNIKIKPKSKERPRAAGKKFNKNGKLVPAFITPKNTKNWESEFKALIMNEIVTQKLQSQVANIYDKPISLKVHFEMPCAIKKHYNTPHQKTPDIDNMLKIVLDGLNGLIFRDDKQVYEVYCKKTLAEFYNINIELTTTGFEIENPI